jgi:hypothetical protein
MKRLGSLYKSISLSVSSSERHVLNAYVIPTRRLSRARHAHSSVTTRNPQPTATLPYKSPGCYPEREIATLNASHLSSMVDLLNNSVRLFMIIV